MIRLNSKGTFFTIWAAVSAFGCYFSMYGFRKPFTAGAFADSSLGGVDYKTWLVTAQVLGYTISKFVGIKVIAEVSPRHRASMILWLVFLSGIALVLFGLIPRPWNIICLFGNGLPLGMVFGLVIGFLEGRRMTEALAAGLCTSFILADGVTKSVGSWLVASGIKEEWMPAAAAGLFSLPLILFVLMLRQIPPPGEDDVHARMKRMAIDRIGRWALISRYGLGLLFLTILYLLVTIIRSIRADFQPELWESLGGAPDAGVFTRTEMLVALGILLANGMTVVIRNNRAAFFCSLGTCAVGLAIIATSLIGLKAGWLSGFYFLVLTGLGLYLPYVAFHTTLFERLLAMSRDIGNLGFLMYVVDSTGYLGYVGVMFFRNFVFASQNVMELFTGLCWLVIGVGTVCLIGAAGYFSRLRPRDVE
jgi:hypothetical protein